MCWMHDDRFAFKLPTSVCVKCVSLSSQTCLMCRCYIQYPVCLLTEQLQRRMQVMEMRCYRKILHISYKKTMLPTRKSVPRSSRQLDHMKISWRSLRDANCSGMVMSPDHQVWPKPSCKAQWKGEEDKAEEEVGRQYQAMDRSGLRQVPKGSGEQEKMEETGYEIICGAPVALAVKG